MYHNIPRKCSRVCDYTRRQKELKTKKNKNYQTSHHHVTFRIRCERCQEVAESQGPCAHSRDTVAVFAVHARPSTESPEYCSPTKQACDAQPTQRCSKCCSALPAHSPHVSFILSCSSTDFDVLLLLNHIILTQCGASSQE